MSKRITKNKKPIEMSSQELFDKLKYKEEVNRIPRTAAEVSERIQDVPKEKCKSYGNRDTEFSSIESNLESRGGFDGNIYQEPCGAKIRGDESGTVYIYDGGHSWAKFEMLTPEQDTIPVRLVDVDSMEDIAVLFVCKNKRSKTNITPEQILVNDFNAGDSAALAADKFLKQIDCYVYCNSDEEGGVIGDPNGTEVSKSVFEKLHAIAKSNQKSGVNAVKAAVSTVTNFDGHSSEKRLHSHLSRAMSMIYSAHPRLLQGGEFSDEFRAWLFNYCSERTLADLTASFQGEAKGHQDSIFVAKGVLKAAKSKTSRLNQRIKNYLKPSSL